MAGGDGAAEEGVEVNVVTVWVTLHSTPQRIALGRAGVLSREMAMRLMRHAQVSAELQWCGPTAWAARADAERLAHVDGLRDKVADEMRRFEVAEKRAAALEQSK